MLWLRIAWHKKQNQLFEIVKTGSPGRWDAIRDIYALQKKICGDCYEAYPVDWNEVFSPIERRCWESIRCIGRLPFYPQYPVDRFFVDFGDPIYRIAIECDGKNWHDKARDESRDSIIRSVGWSVFRVTGRQCNLPDDDPESVHSFLEQLAVTFYGPRALVEEAGDEQ